MYNINSLTRQLKTSSRNVYIDIVSLGREFWYDTVQIQVKKLFFNILIILPKSFYQLAPSSALEKQKMRNLVSNELKNSRVLYDIKS